MFIITFRGSRESQTLDRCVALLVTADRPLGWHYVMYIYKLYIVIALILEIERFRNIVFEIQTQEQQEIGITLSDFY